MKFYAPSGSWHSRLPGFCLPGEVSVKPGPDVAYQMNLEYLAEVCKRLAEQFRREYEQWDDDDSAD